MKNISKLKHPMGPETSYLPETNILKYSDESFIQVIISEIKFFVVYDSTEKLLIHKLSLDSSFERTLANRVLSTSCCFKSTHILLVFPHPALSSPPLACRLKSSSILFYRMACWGELLCNKQGDCAYFFVGIFQRFRLVMVSS